MKLILSLKKGFAISPAVNPLVPPNQYIIIFYMLHHRYYKMRKLLMYAYMLMNRINKKGDSIEYTILMKACRLYAMRLL